MKIEVFGVYLVDFKTNFGGELNGKHYAVVLTTPSIKDKTFLVAPITSKKPKIRYRGGFTIDSRKYQTNPSCEKCFIKVRKIREVDIKRVLGKRIYKLDNEDIEKLKKVIAGIFDLNSI